VLTPHDIETIRAALTFWREEISPHGESAARPYFESTVARVLSEIEVEALRDRLAQALLRYAVVEKAGKKLASIQLYGTPEEAATVAGAAQVATIILPAA